MIKNFKKALIVGFAFLLCFQVACTAKKQDKAAKSQPPEASMEKSSPATSPPAQLPVRYQTPAFVTPTLAGIDQLGEPSDEYQIKVGATIRSTSGPQPLWEVLKRLVNLKGMTVSWANDVDQNTLVDVDIAASDNFFDAIANLLRQSDYFHEVNGKNIVIRNKTTKVYQIGVPFMKGGYTTNVGGNFLSSKEAASGTEGSVKITSQDNSFNVWENIETNLKIILQTAEAERQEAVIAAQAAQQASNMQGDARQQSSSPPGGAASANDPTKNTQSVSNNTARDGSTFIIDKSLGIVTVTAKPNVLKSVDDYIGNLKKHMYQQVNIEAKIIEVYLQDSSRLGLDWSSVLKNKPVGGTVFFGNNGQVYPYNTPSTNQFANTFVSRVVLEPFSFEVLLNALNEQGDAHVLSNPRLTVLNGQPAIISVGKDVAYVKKVTAEVDNEANSVTYSAETDNVVQGIALGVMASIRDNNTIIMHLTPITTDLENLTPEGDIPTTTVGTGPGAVQLGLPKVRVREMSTMVEVNDGEMLIIGGLIDSIETKSGSFAPGLGSIPGIRYLFGVEEKSLQKRELVILLSPKII